MLSEVPTNLTSAGLIRFSLALTVNVDEELSERSQIYDGGIVEN